jgi:putative heme-binding domain-containing protein
MRRRLAALAKSNDPADIAVAEQLHLALYPPGTPDAPPRPAARPAALQDWQSTLATGGDPASGRRVFFSQQAGCAQCHTIHNRGGRIGPDLSNIAQSRNRNQLIHAILKPSDEYSIDYQAWFIRTKDKEMHLGLQLDLKDRGDIELYTLDAKTTRFRARDIAAYGALKQSIMPDDLDAALTVTDFRDLIAFLSSLK